MKDALSVVAAVFVLIAAVWPYVFKDMLQNVIGATLSAIAPFFQPLLVLLIVVFAFKVMFKGVKKG